MFCQESPAGCRAGISSRVNYDLFVSCPHTPHLRCLSSQLAIWNHTAVRSAVNICFIYTVTVTTVCSQGLFTACSDLMVSLPLPRAVGGDTLD